MIKAVLFDFGGVLTESGQKGFIAATLAELYQVEPAKMDIGDLHYLYRRGKGGDENQFFEVLNQRYGKVVTKEMFLKEVQKTFIPSAPVFEMAESMRERGIRTGILSNIFTMNAQELRRQGWYDYFDPVVLSCEEGFAKPETELYLKAIERTGAKPEEILFIDDQDKCIPPAKALGMHTILASSPDQTVTDTKRLIRELNGIEL